MFMHAYQCAFELIMTNDKNNLIFRYFLEKLDESLPLYSFVLCVALFLFFLFLKLVASDNKEKTCSSYLQTKRTVKLLTNVR